MAQMAKRRQTPYGEWLTAKQKVKKFYGKLTERQFQDVYRDSVQASFQGGSGSSLLTATDHLIGRLESRVDVLLYRSGLATSVAHANQWVSHGKVVLNEKRVYSSGICLKAGDCLRLLPPFDSGIFGKKTLSLANASPSESGSEGIRSSGRKGDVKSGDKGLFSVKSSANSSKGSKEVGASIVDQNIGGHFVVSSKLASLVYLRQPRLAAIPKYPFVGKMKNARRGGPAVRGAAAAANKNKAIASTNKEVYGRVVAFCSRG